MTVTGIVDGSGSVSFAGGTYRAGRSWIRSPVQVAIVGASVQLSVDGKVIRFTPSATTAPRNTAPSPLPTVGPVGRRPPEG